MDGPSVIPTGAAADRLIALRDDGNVDGDEMLSFSP